MKLIYPATIERARQRFWLHVDRSGGPNACWIWTGSRGYYGYGRVNVSGSSYLAHRMAYALTKGDPGCFWVLHDCPEGDNPSCVNPQHLWLGTAEDNSQDMAQKRRHGAHTHPERFARGERAGSAKLTETEVANIRQELARGTRGRLLAQRFGVSESVISCIKLRQTWCRSSRRRQTCRDERS